MKRTMVHLACGVVLVGGVGGASGADGELTGDPRLACEAILCLASGTKPAQCSASMARYFSISFPDWRDTINGRINFLKLCPGAQVNGDMARFVSAMGNAVGRCDWQSLNMTLQVQGQPCGVGPGGDYTMLISDDLPDYCATFIQHQYTRLGGEAPRYVGRPEDGGFWSDVDHYAADVVAYQNHTGKWNSASQCQAGIGPGWGIGDNWWQ